MISRLKPKELAEAKRILMSVPGKLLCPLCDCDLRALESKDVVLDHCHENGWIRGLLCRNCNGMEGRVRHYANRAKRNRTVVHWINKVLAYWELHSTNQTGVYHPKWRTANEKKFLRNKRARLRRARAKKSRVNTQSAR